MPETTKSRPADRCDDVPGRLRPVIDRNRCEAKGDCVAACPYDVFEIARITDEIRRGQSWLGWVKTLAHGGTQAFAVRAADCHACGLCVEAPSFYSNTSPSMNAPLGEPAQRITPAFADGGAVSLTRTCRPIR